jgi:hypothetical protein
LSRFTAGRIVIAFACFTSAPLLTVAQESSHPPVIAEHAAPASSSSTSAVNEAWFNLPEAPVPQAQQSGTAQTQNPKPNKQQTTPPNANGGLTLQGLGFSPAQTQANARLQARLNTRTHMLQIHQRLGLITLAPMVASVLVSGGAKQKHDPSTGTLTEPNSSGVDLHVALGSLTVAMYSATAYYAIAAPKIPGMKVTGAVKLHRDLAFIHAPGMVLIPILGSMALNQENQGEKVHGIASLHAPVAAITIGAYAASVIAVSWPIHLKFWEHSK